MRFIPSFSQISSCVIALSTALLLTACGGSSSPSSNSGGSGGSFSSASISGNVRDGVAMNELSLPSAQITFAVVNLLMQEAHAVDVSGVTVELVLNGTTIATQITGASGNFMFDDLTPGNYSIRLSQGGSVIGNSAPITLNENMDVKVELSLDGAISEFEAFAGTNRISGEVEDSLSEDDVSDDSMSEDDISEDDVSEDSISEDDDSEDSISEDDDSEDSISEDDDSEVKNS